MKLDQQEQETIEILRNLSGESVERINNILLALMIYTFLNYSTGEDVLVPYFGKFLLKKESDTKATDVKGFFLPSDYVKQNIKMYEEMKKGNCAIEDIPIFKYYKAENSKTLRAIINDEEVQN